MAEQRIIGFRVDKRFEKDIEKVMEHHRCTKSEAIRQAIIAYSRQLAAK